MRHNPRFLITAFCMMTALGSLGCAHQPHTVKPDTSPTKPVIETVDRVFIASAIRLDELNHTIHDIKTRHVGSDITILVRYPLRQPFASSKDLAFEQAETVKTYMQEQDITTPIRVITSPADQKETTIWISYAADQTKGSGVIMHDIPVLPTAPASSVASSTTQK